jgi:hypothetical protein
LVGVGVAGGGWTLGSGVALGGADGAADGVAGGAAGEAGVAVVLALQAERAMTAISRPADAKRNLTS